MNVKSFQWVLATALATVPSFAFAETFYLSQPGLCGVEDGVLEETDAIILNRRSMGNHYFDCGWKKPVTLKRNDWSASRKATCENSTDVWQAEFEFVTREKNALAVFQTSGGLGPVIFYRCDK